MFPMSCVKIVALDPNKRGWGEGRLENSVENNKREDWNKLKGLIATWNYNDHNDVNVSKFSYVRIKF